MESQNDLEVRAVADEILCYLSKHSKAADTLDGIVQWWLIHERYLKGLNQVRHALDLLVENGFVVERMCADGQRIYQASMVWSNRNQKGRT